MTTIVTRAGKGSPLTNSEMDTNLNNLNTDKIEATQAVTLTNKTRGSGTAINAEVTNTSTDSFQIPAGTDAQRPTGVNGKIRYNTTLSKYEGYSGTSWSALGGGATGGGNDEIFVQNGQTVTTSYTIPSGKNAHSVGPITVNSGVTVTISDGSRWVIS